MDKDLVTPIVQPASSRTKHTQPVPAAAMNMGDFADMLSNPQGSKPANQPSTQEKADFADLLSDPKGAEAKFVSSNSSPALKKSYTQGDTKTKKPKRIQRQVLYFPVASVVILIQRFNRIRACLDHIRNILSKQ